MTETSTIKHLDKDTCIMCGEDTHKLENLRDRRCYFCGEIKTIPIECDNFHCLCKDCLNLTPQDFVLSMCLKYKNIDPIELSVDIMNSPVIRMHGAEHHFIVPAVLITSLHNYQHKSESLETILNYIKRRAISETPHTCSYDLKTCGAALGTGVFLSVFLNRELSDEDQWSPSNAIIAESLKNVSDSGGQRCCKRDTYLSIQSAINLLKDEFAIELPLSLAKCTFSLRNRTCKHEECQFYNLSNSIV